MIQITTIGRIRKIVKSNNKYHPDEYLCVLFTRQGSRLINNEWHTLTACVLASTDEYTAKKYQSGQYVLINGICTGIIPAKDDDYEAKEEARDITFEYTYKIKINHIELVPLLKEQKSECTSCETEESTQLF